MNYIPSSTSKTNYARYTTGRKRSVIAIGTQTSTPLRSDMKPVYPPTSLLHLLAGKMHTAAELTQFYETSPSNRIVSNIVASMFPEYRAEPFTLSLAISSFLTSLLMRMNLSPNDPNALIVSLPFTHPDVFHEVDIMGDAAAAYGFNSLPGTVT
ncbi:hypothetical protein EDD22DRAFT_955508 [Suillus occidentalis]|nr:hypothetical protein EDD22DRAFT_955508 [Suillus occidentalis]